MDYMDQTQGRINVHNNICLLAKFHERKFFSCSISLTEQNFNKCIQYKYIIVNHIHGCTKQNCIF